MENIIPFSALQKAAIREIVRQEIDAAFAEADVDNDRIYNATVDVVTARPLVDYVLPVDVEPVAPLDESPDGRSWRDRPPLFK